MQVNQTKLKALGSKANNIRGPVGVLTVQVKQANNLPEGQFCVVVQQGNMSSKTAVKPGPTARFGETFTFNIDTEETELVVSVYQPRSDQLFFESALTFDEICGPNDSNVYPKDFKCENEHVRISVDVSVTYEPNVPAQLSYRVSKDDN